jgi:hypothetical protein
MTITGAVARLCRSTTLRWGVIPALLAVLAAVLVVILIPPAARPDQLIPLYDNASPGQWAAACSEVNHDGAGSFVVTDANEVRHDVGAPSAASWAGMIDSCARQGRAAVLGYVWTDYGRGGTASVPNIEAQVRSWYASYPGRIGGIFFDGVSDLVPGTGISNVTFYRDLASYVHGHESRTSEVVFNFGANPSSGWMFNPPAVQDANLVVVFEGSYDRPAEHPYTGWAPASWESRYPAADFAAIVYDTASTAGVPQPATVCDQLTRQHLGYLYVDISPSYSQLPPYFSAFLRDC